MSKKKTEEVEACTSFDKESIIITDDAVYNIQLMPDISDFTEDTIKDDVAYIDNGYFYLYRGVPKTSDFTFLKPGIYKKRPEDKEHEDEFFIVPINTSDEKEEKEYNALEHASHLVPTEIINEANEREEILTAIPESTKIFQPTLSEDDDILKRAAKLILIKKNIDLDRNKDRFANKNELFNLKQVIRGKNKVSILIFNRECDAVNVKYTLTIEEKSDNDIVGDKLTEPIVISSEDGYYI